MKPYNLKIVWTPARLEVLKELRDSGMFFKEIGEIMGCTRLSASNAWHRYILPTLPKVSTVVEGIPVVAVENRKPTLAYVPHLWPNPRYKMKSECSANAR